MSTESSTESPDRSSSPLWHPLEAIDRRVLGVLVEKAKTTPDVYPLSLNSLKSGCNQKSNRFPQMQLEEALLEDSLDRLRKFKAVTLIQGDGRVEKFRHLAYEWLGVGKVELAIMAELLLRGAQTIGEVRARASRMEPIRSQEELGPLLQSLQSKGLIVYLTPPGRGAVITHNLYLPREFDKVQREHGIVPSTESHPPLRFEDSEAPPLRDISPSQSPTQVDERQDVEVHQLREEVAHLRATLAVYRDEVQQQVAELKSEIQALGKELRG